MVGGKIIPRIRLISAKDLVEVEAELGNLFRETNLYTILLAYQDLVQIFNFKILIGPVSS